MKKIAVLLTVICLVLTVAAAGISVSAATVYTQDGYSYTIINSSAISLYGWDDRSSSLVLPSGIGERYFTEIRDSALSGDSVITSVSFSDALVLERIGYYAFCDCANLSGTVVIGGHIKTVGVSAFQNCTSLEAVRYVGWNVSEIADQCFYGCTSLSEVILPERLQSIGKLAFAGCPSLGGIMIPKTVTFIDNSAFSGSENVVINCYSGSYAEQYAIDNHLIYILLDPPTEDPTEFPDDPEPEYQVVTFILGDADGDGYVSILDATKIQRVLAKFDEDTDGMITLRGTLSDEAFGIMDATRIQRKLALYDDPYHIGESMTVYIYPDGTVVNPSDDSVGT